MVKRSVTFAAAMFVPALLCCFAHIGRAQDAPRQKVVALAFYGSYANYLTFTAPLLQKNGFTGTFYACDNMDRPPVMLGPRFLTWPQIRELAGMGFEIGNQMMEGSIPVGPGPTQKFLHALEAIEQECAAVGIPKPVTFAYSSGIAPRPALQILADKGYQSALEGMDGALYDPQLDHPLLIPSTDFFHGSDDDNRKRFQYAMGNLQSGGLLVLSFGGMEYPSERDLFKEFIKYLKDNNITTVSVSAIAGNAAGGMRDARMWRRTGDEYLPVAPEGGFAKPPVITPLERQLEQLVVPAVDFDKLPLGSALDFLKQQAAKVSNGALQPGFAPGPGFDASTPVTLHLANVPFMEALRYLGDLAGVEFVADQYAVSVKPKTPASPRVTPKIPAAPAQINALESLVLPAVNFKDASLGTVLDALTRQAAAISHGSVKPDFVTYPGVDVSAPVTLRLANTPLMETLRYLGDLAGANFVPDRCAISVIPAAASSPRATAKTPATGNQMQTLRALIIPRIDLKEPSLQSALEFLLQEAAKDSNGSVNLSFVVDPGLSVLAPVTLHLDNIPFTEALRYVGDETSADFTVERYAVSVKRRLDPARATPTPAPTPFALVK